MLDSLPVDDVVPDLINALRQTNCAVLQAPTGAGKTTRVPSAILDQLVEAGKQIMVVEPRRIAARAAARRVAAERDSHCGNEVGYHVRFDRCAGSNTRLTYVTPGILLQQLHSDSLLEKLRVIVFDEFHERGLESDLTLGFCRLLQQTIRPELRILATSATLAAEQVAQYLENCPIIVSEGRLHPVEIRHEARPPTMSWPKAAAEAVKRLLTQTPGDILVFLPGWAEIRQTARLLEPLATQRSLAVLPLHGDLSPAEQDRALSRLAQRKVVLATNVAETSITVEGVTGVVDTGLARQLSFDAGVGLDRLQILPISRASADQRAGRAGRTQSGMCIRLWDERNHRARPEHTGPEVQRVDLAGAILHLLALGEGDPVKFPWPEAPNTAAIDRAIAILKMLGAVSEKGLTDLGSKLARLPVHPRLGRLLVDGARMGQPHSAALAAALLAERDPFRKLSTIERSPTQSDILDRMEALESFEHDGRFQFALGELDRGSARHILGARDQLERMVAQIVAPDYTSLKCDEVMSRAIGAAYPDRVCRRRNPGGRKCVMVGGRGVRLDNRSTVTRSQLFIAVDLEAGREESTARIASAIDREWLDPRLISTSIDTEVDADSGRIKAWKRTRYCDLLLDETETTPPEDAASHQTMLEFALQQIDRILPRTDSPAGMFRTRVRCLREWRPELKLPALDQNDMRELLEGMISSCQSLTDLRKADWMGLFRSRLSYEQLQALERDAPDRLTTPNGRSFALAYEEARAPIFAVKIQDLFGMTETPRIANGRVPVLLHLLAPNNRPQQVTDDLTSFWRNTYPVVRKELRARYPKHAWPEDPLTSKYVSRNSN